MYEIDSIFNLNRWIFIKSNGHGRSSESASPTVAFMAGQEQGDPWRGGDFTPRFREFPVEVLDRGM